MRPYLLLIPLALCGCSGLRSAVMAGGGAGIASAFTRSPAIIGSAAAGGALLGEGWNRHAKQSERNAYNEGYLRGRGDTTKQHYWNLQDK